MTDKPENPQAYPHGNPVDGGELGMTLRDYAIIHYSAAIITNTEFMTAVGDAAKGPKHMATLVNTVAAQMADAMLKARMK